MAKLVSMTLDDKQMVTSYTYEASDGKQFTGKMGAVVEARADAYDEVRNSTLGRLIAERVQERAKADDRVPVTLRLPPALSQRLHDLAKAQGKSLNAFMLETLTKELEQ
jgi:hypothetical protein